MKNVLSRRSGLLAASLGLASALFRASPASAQSAWKLGSAAQPGSPLIQFGEHFINQVNNTSGGAIRTEHQFVASEQELINQVIRGRLQSAQVSYAGSAAVVPELAVFTIPYLWASEAERAWVMEKHGEAIAARFYAEKGVVMIGGYDIRYTGVVCKIDCRAPATLRGIKARVSPSPASRVFWRQLGAAGAQMSLADLFPALQQGVVEAADLPFVYYVTTPAAQSNPVFIETNHTHHHGAFIVNKAAFDRLPANVQSALRAAPLPLQKTAEMNIAAEAELRARFRAGGGTFHEMSDTALEDWRRLIVPAQLDVVREIGGRAQEVWDALQKGKAEYSAQRR
jgi:TRAP-type C4-dicarboxylate transport system substrate-binding protein